MKANFLSLLGLAISLESVVGYCDSVTGDPAPSVVSVPISINLAAMEQELNARVPEHLETIDLPGQVCVEAEWLKTKGVPKCTVKDWYKVYCEDTWIKTKVTPEVSCDVSGWVKRNGRITLRGSGSRLSLDVPVKAEVTARGRGDIGKNITQTLKAGAVISAALAPDITPDWQPTMAIDTDFSWTQRPKFKLFNLIPVTVGSKVEPELRKLLDDLEAQIPSLLAAAKLKDQITAVWTQVQEPIVLDKIGQVQARFTPTLIGFSGIDTTQNVLKAWFSIAGFPQVTLGEGPVIAAPSPLPPLTRIAPEEPRFAVALPIEVQLARLQSLAREQLDALTPIDLEGYGYKSKLEISDLAIAAKGGSLTLSLDFALDSNEGFWNRLDVFGWLDIKGRVSFTALPIVDDTSNIVRLGELSFDTSTNNLLADSLVEIAKLPPIRELIRKSISYNFSEDLRDLRQLLGKELNRKLSDQVRIGGRIDDLAVKQPQVNASAIRVPVMLQGAAEILVGL